MKVYLFFHGNEYPSGGVKVLFHIASTLKKMGFETMMIVPRESPKINITWFDLDGIEITNNFDQVTADDIVILPEETLWVFYDLVGSRGCRYIIINQGAYWSLTNYLGLDYTRMLYQKALGIFVNSEYTAGLVTRLFGKLNIYKFSVPIIGKFEPYANKSNTICFMPRKNNETAECISQFVEGTYKNWQIKPMDKLHHDEIIKIMNQSKIFLSFGGPEGFGMPPVEAALAGCKVIGYHGYGGLEYFKEPIFTPLPPLEIPEFIGHIDIYTSLLQDKNPLQITGFEEQMNMLKQKYSIDKFRADIISGFSQMLLRPKL